MNGVNPKVMQELAGHARAATTLEIYTHVNMDAKRGVDEGGIRRVLMEERSAETICLRFVQT